MRLTADLINSSLSYLNPLKERELDLRGHKIPSIENLGGAKDHDALDLTDNDIASLSNIPFIPRLHTLLLARNRIAHITPSLVSSIPNLTTLVLEANRLRELADLDPLAHLPRLTHLVLRGCPVANNENYRLWTLWRCPSVRFLDYAKVRDAEREEAKKRFGSADEMTALAAKIANLKSRNTFDVPETMETEGSSGDGIARLQLTDKERGKIQKMIKSARTFAEMTALEKALSEGRVPDGVMDVD